MSIKITHDANAPTASVELMITRSLPDYDLEEIAAAVPRDIDPILASQGFKDLLDETRSILETELADGMLEVAQLTGAICADGKLYRPGVWLVLREAGVAAGQPMSAAARERIAAIAETLRANLQPS